MKWIRRLLAILTVLAAVIIVGGLALPSTVHVERSIVIAAAAAKVFPYVNNYRLFNTWSPWARKHPETRYTFSGPESGVGAKMSWTGQNEFGNQVIVESEPDRRVKVALDFGGMGKATATYTLSPEGNGTKVIWGFDEDFGWNLPARYFGLMFEKFIGPDYEQGLAALKAKVEGRGNEKP